MSYIWWPAEQTAKIRADLEAAGEGATLEVHHADKEHSALIKIVGGANPRPLDDGGTNHSFHCPPICV